MRMLGGGRKLELDAKNQPNKKQSRSKIFLRFFARRQPSTFSSSCLKVCFDNIAYGSSNMAVRCESSFLFKSSCSKSCLAWNYCDCK